MLGVLLVVLFFVAVFATVAQSMFRKWNRFNRPYEYINKRYQGHFHRGFVLSRPKLWFDYGTTSIRVQNRKSFGSGRRSTELFLRWNERRTLSFEITKRDEQISEKMRGSEVSIPIPELKDKFIIQTNQPHIMNRLLTNAVCWQVNQLASVNHNSSLSVKLRRGGLKIEMGGWFVHDERIDDFVRFSLELFDRLQLAECEGIDFVNEDEVGVVEEAICPICSETINYTMVVCVRCKTPHCIDCWHYNGQCATFACEEKRYIRT